jgi:TetR/AcrR family transcriptional regulator, cholesterol catabolism regulator
MPPAGPPADRSGGRADRAQSDRKQEVVAVAKRLFAERGVRQTTVREIGASVGILSGSLYHHFGSKDDLVDYIVRDFCDAVLKRYDEITSEDVDSPAKLRAMARYAFSLIGSAPDEMAIVADEYLYAPTDSKAPSRFDYVVRFNAKVGQHWYDVLESGVQTGEFRSSIHARSLYRLVRDAIMGATRWWVPSKDMTTDDIADALVEIVLRGIVRRAA